MELCVETSRSKTNGLIVDTRPMINAMANRAQGKGYENVEHYTKCEFQFLGIENIHVMRKSLERLESDGWLASDWLKERVEIFEEIFIEGWGNKTKATSVKHIYAVMDVSNKVKQAVQEGKTVIVHCSDGWDRTSQVCSGNYRKTLIFIKTRNFLLEKFHFSLTEAPRTLRKCKV